jgi:two-component system, NtrC family, response regulator HydG
MDIAVKKEAYSSGKDEQDRLRHQQRSNELAERVKELNCLYGISNLFETEGASLPWIMQRAVNLIPAAWQYPDYACARIILGRRQFKTDPFEETRRRQSEQIAINGEPIGKVEVFYRGDYPGSEAGLFLEEESKLLKSIAQRLGKVYWLKQAEEYLRESEERYRILTEHVDEGVTLIHRRNFAYVNPAFCELFRLESPEALVGKPFRNPGVEAADIIKAAYKAAPKTTSSKKAPQEVCLKHKGRDRWIQAYHIPITYKGTPALLSTFKDITNLKRREIEAQQKARTLQQENLALKGALRERYRLGPIIGKSAAMQEVYELILRAASSDSSVTIFGESGTGKELAAREIHEHSPRKRGRFIAVNCGAIPESIFEREFFGHCRGAFSGAHANAPGFLDMADGGTLFLDEIGELTVTMQVKLLRALEGDGYYPVGGTVCKHADIRIISASNTPLQERVRAGLMRKDFFYRVQVIQINLPPLRERREDMPLLIEHFASKHSRSRDVHLPGHILEVLMSHDWPGNVRELRNVLERWFTLNKIDFLDKSGVQEGSLKALGMRAAVKEFEINLISRTLNQCGGNQSLAARLLGISRRSLFRKLQGHGTK